MAFVKGKSGNPTGLRKEKLFFEALIMEMKAEPEVRGLRVIARKMLDLAVSGDMQAIKEIRNSVDGLPVAAVDLSVNDNRTIEDYSDSELLTIIRGGGVDEAEAGEKQPNQVH